jgi:hypothetical protein
MNLDLINIYISIYRMENHRSGIGSIFEMKKEKIKLFFWNIKLYIYFNLNFE